MDLKQASGSYWPMGWQTLCHFCPVLREVEEGALAYRGSWGQYGVLEAVAEEMTLIRGWSRALGTVLSSDRSEQWPRLLVLLHRQRRVRPFQGRASTQH